MLSIIANNTMNSGSMNNRQELSVLSMIRGLERQAGLFLREFLALVAVGSAHSLCVVRPATRGSQRRLIATKRWQPGFEGYLPLGYLPLSHGQPAGAGTRLAG